MAPRTLKRAAQKPADESTSKSAKKKRIVIELSVPEIPKERGLVMTCGQGDVGQLGQGDRVLECKKFRPVLNLAEDIVDVQAGGMHTAALDRYGKVWTWGCNDEGALGREVLNDAEGLPGPVLLPGAAVALSAGDSHSAALLHNGDVYLWGAFRDSHGCMGLLVRDKESQASLFPLKVDIGELAVDIASGTDHLVILTKSNKVFTLGCGEQGQLGRVSARSATRDARQWTTSLLAPARVPLKMGASRIWAGNYATFALDASGTRMFAWGLNNHLQLGVTGKNHIFNPMECDAFASCAGSAAGWQSVACGQHHTLALDKSGQVYAIGRGEYGRLGLGSREDATHLEPVPEMTNCVHIAAGTSNSLAVTREGSMFAWGMGSEGLLGTGNTDDAQRPTPCVLVSAGRPGRVFAAAAGGQHTVALVNGGEPSTSQEPSQEQLQPKARQGRKRPKTNRNSEDSNVSLTQPELDPEPEPQPEPEPAAAPVAQPAPLPPAAPVDQKLNGGSQNEEAPMEVDESPNKTEENIMETQMNEESSETHMESNITAPDQTVGPTDSVSIPDEVSTITDEEPAVKGGLELPEATGSASQGVNGAPTYDQVASTA